MSSITRGVHLPSADLLLLGLLLFLTASFGRSFSKVGIEQIDIYVTEVILTGVAVLAIRRLGGAEIIQRVRRTMPLLLLGGFVLAGLLALMRGLADWGFSRTLNDVGLAEYVLVLLLVVVLVNSAAEARWLTGMVVAGGAAAIVLFGATIVLPDSWPPWGWATLGSAASGIYIACYACWAAARIAHGLPLRRGHYFMLLCGFALLALTYARSVWVASVIALAALVLLAPRGKRLDTAIFGICAFIFTAAIAYGIEQFELSRERKELAANAAAVEAQSLGPTLGESPIREKAADTPSGGDATSPEFEITQATRETFQNNLSEGSNVVWRLAIWEFMLRGVLDEPIFGVGFGQPTHFRWSSHIYDARNDDPNNPFDVTGPHNSFVNVIFRMGLVGTVSLLGLMGVAFVRVRSWLRVNSDPTAERARVVALIAAFAFICVVASFNVALEGPFMGIFFWTVLGILLAIPRIPQEATFEPTSPPDASRAVATLSSQ